MNIIVIGFDPKNLTATQKTEVLTIIKSQPSWARLVPNVYAVKTNLSVSEMRDKIIISDIRVFVYEVTNQLWAGYSLPKDVAQWLSNNWQQ